MSLQCRRFFGPNELGCAWKALDLSICWDGYRTSLSWRDGPLSLWAFLEDGTLCWCLWQALISRSHGEGFLFQVAVLSQISKPICMRGLEMARDLQPTHMVYDFSGKLLHWDFSLFWLLVSVWFFSLCQLWTLLPPFRYLKYQSEAQTSLVFSEVILALVLHLHYFGKKLRKWGLFKSYVRY